MNVALCSRCVRDLWPDRLWPSEVLSRVYWLVRFVTSTWLKSMRPAGEYKNMEPESCCRWIRTAIFNSPVVSPQLCKKAKNGLWSVTCLLQINVEGAVINRLAPLRLASLLNLATPQPGFFSSRSTCKVAGWVLSLGQPFLSSKNYPRRGRSTILSAGKILKISFASSTVTIFFFDFVRRVHLFKLSPMAAVLGKLPKSVSIKKVGELKW